MQTRAIITVAIALLIAACGTTKSEKQKADVQKAAHVGLGELTDEVNGRVQHAANEIILKTDRRETKRLMITWQLRTLEYCRRVRQLPDLRLAFVDLWTMLYRTKLYVESAAGEEVLGDLRSIAIEELDGLIAMMTARGSEVLSEKQLETVTAAARDWAANNPIRGQAVDYESRPSLSRGDAGVITAIGNLPADLFSIGGGVKDTAEAVNNVSDSADRAAGVIESLPTSLRLQVELLLYRLEEDQTIARLLDDLDGMSDAVAKIGATVDDLPSRIQKVLTGTIRDLEGGQPELRKTVSEVRGTIEGVERALVKADDTLGHADQTGVWIDRSLSNATEAGKAWEGAFGQLNLVVNPPKDPNEPPSEPAPPFDMKDVAVSAEWLTKAATELHGTVTDVRAVIDGDGIDKRLAQVDRATDSTLAKASESAAGLIDRITWRAIIVILVFFASLLGYRLAIRKL